MDITQLRHYLDHPHEAGRWLAAWKLDDVDRAHASLIRMAMSGITLDLLGNMCDQFAEHLPRLSDADMALNNLDRFIAATRNPLSLATLFERDREALPILLQIFSTSQYLSDLLVIDSEAYDLLRMTEGQPVARNVIVDELCAEVAVLNDERSVMTALRRFKRRETLRIAYGDIIRGQRLEIVTGQISHLADAILEAAFRFARNILEQKRGVPRRSDGQPSRFAVLAMGKLGGGELNYSSDIDLIFLYETDGETDGQRALSNVEFFDRLARDLIKLLTEPTNLGTAYRVDLRLRPEGQHGPMVPSLESALHYYDVSGRTWERQAFLKARAAAGDLDFGQEFLRQLEPWIYRRYLSRADIAGIKALKRRIEQNVKSEGADLRNVKTGHGGIRDIEFTIQFLQLLSGGDLPELHTGNTLIAIAMLENSGCFTHQERTILEENYAFLRKTEHRLQLMFDLQTHLLPISNQELRRLAIRMGYTDTPERPALDAFTADYKQRTVLNRKILDHLLHDAFGDEGNPEPEVDLILDPDPQPAQITGVLGRYPFHDSQMAYQNLMTLSQERIRFLSTRRCRHFLASIAPRLVPAIAATPDPDQTLVNLSKVSDSLGGKGVLWELFSFNPPSLHMYVELCASSPYLSSILISNPGMIDELMDSLVLDKLPTRETLEANLNELAHGAEDLDLILHSFKNAQVLRVGVRDILGKEDIVATCSALADIAEACLRLITRTEHHKLVAKMGEPMIPEGEQLGQNSEFIVLAMGKFGGREINYHSDLDMVFLYEADGATFHARRSKRSGETSTNQHFFSELGQRVIKAGSQLGPHGRLYEIDPRLRPTGKSGALATSLAEFRRYFEEGSGQLWERQALCKARVVYGSPKAAAIAMQTVIDCAYLRPWHPEYADEIRNMRHRMEHTAKTANLKRGPGGLVDVEFVAQMLQLKHGGKHPEVRVPATLDALEKLEHIGAISREDFDFFSTSYRVLLAMVSRLRLMNTTARHDLPDDPEEQIKLARLLEYPDREKMLIDCERLTRENRVRFDKIFAREGAGTSGGGI
ncbi:MAG TPA: bifunctional [glutamate--ammonia ligase]-adenylyl-L-tyrosine phosphorylase/[glutamate--ammonia-ligase] adenylyltransferase [Pirellulales bacterium]|jgi:glutamate-ammonia-ligase adenylyltransferase